MSDGPRLASTSVQSHLLLAGTDRAEKRTIRPFDAEDLTSTWNQLFGQFTSIQKVQLFGLASQQGHLFANQVVQTIKRGNPGPQTSRLTKILNERFDDLEPIHETPIVCADSELDKTQQRAVACALNTPEICLIQGLPGTGKSRVVAEIIRQANLRGDRVLFVSPWSTTLDSLLTTYSTQGFLVPWRLLDQDEKLEDLPPQIRAFTSEDRFKSLTDQVVPAINRQILELETNHRAMRLLEYAWPRLYALAEERRQIDQDFETCSVAPSVLMERIAGELQTAESRVGKDDRLEDLTAELNSWQIECDAVKDKLLALASLRAEKTQLIEELERRLGPLSRWLECKDRGQFWKIGWWKALMSPQSIANGRSIQTQLKQETHQLKELDDQIAAFSINLEKQSAQYEINRTALIQNEMQLRLAELGTKTKECQARLRSIEESWQKGCIDLGINSEPIACNKEAVSSAEASWKEDLLLLEKRLDYLKQWLPYVKEETKDINAWINQAAKLVVASVKTILSQRLIASDDKDPSFDLLIVDGAHEVMEQEVVALAKYCRRFVLVGEPIMYVAVSPAVARRHRGSQVQGRGNTKPPLFHRLWKQLHSDPRILPYRWHWEDGRFCCQLQEIKAEQRHWVEAEPVADHSEIELRILSVPGKAPTLVEVVFPSSTSLGQAKEYIFSELQELAVQTPSSNFNWIEKEHCFSLTFGDECYHHFTSIAITAGVTEHIQGAKPRPQSSDMQPSVQTCCLEFHKEAGWTRAQAEMWLESHLRLKDLKRTVCLDRAYRMKPALGQFLSEVLFQGRYRFPLSSNVSNADDSNGSLSATSAETPFEFISTASSLDSEKLAKGSSTHFISHNFHRSGGTSTIPRVGKTGWAQEIDLADPSQRLRLPREISVTLPKMGLVNYEEALRVVRMIESLVNDPFGNLVNGGSHGKAFNPSIGVIALYQAQVELLRRLIDQVPSLVASPMPILVDIPSGFRAKECMHVLISLTRSHSQRTTSYGGNPDMLVLALTRARHKLFIFGDPANLIRRSQWQGIVETLNEESSAVEHQLISRLVTHLREQGALAPAFQTHSGGWK